MQFFSLACVLLCCALPCVGADGPALAGDLELSDFAGRVDACQAPLVAFNETCTCPEGHTWHNQTCTPCSAGFFKASPGLHACSACPEHMTSFDGAVDAAECLCSAGYFAALAACQLCPLALHKSFVGNNSCVPCPPHTNTTALGTTDMLQCICNPGYVVRTDGVAACLACPRNTFSQAPGELSCSPCPANSGTAAEGSVLSACQCNAGYTKLSETCTACGVGTYKASNANGACESCPEHMSSGPASTLLTNCTCNAGYERSSADACTPCAANAFCPGHDEKTACTPNSTSTVGSAARAQCTCLPGFFRNGETCLACSEGFYCNNNLRTLCPTNSSSPVLSYAIDNCTCMSGFVSD